MFTSSHLVAVELRRCKRIAASFLRNLWWSWGTDDSIYKGTEGLIRLKGKFDLSIVRYITDSGGCADGKRFRVKTEPLEPSANESKDVEMVREKFTFSLLKESSIRVCQYQTYAGLKRR